MYCFLHMNNIYLSCCTLQWRKTPTAMKNWQLLDLWAASHITSHKPALSVKQSIFTRDRYILFKISFVSNTMHVYKIKTQSKLHGTTLRVSVNWIHWEYSWLLPLRWNHPLLQGFHCCWYFCAMEQDWRGETLKARSFLCGEECRKTSPPSPDIPLLPCLPSGPSQCVLRSFASRLGYRAWMSWLMDTKQRCPWWRRVRKTRKHSGFKHTDPTPQLFLFLSDSLSVSVCSQSA